MEKGPFTIKRQMNDVKNHVGCISRSIKKADRAPLSTVVILLKATKHAERKQINKSHWLNNVSRAHFIGREQFPKHQFLVF